MSRIIPRRGASDQHQPCTETLSKLEYVGRSIRNEPAWTLTEENMSNTFKMVTLIGTSPETYEAAIDNALTDASVSLRNISWFEVVEMRGSVHEGRAAEFQVKLQVAFKVEVS